jgi:uncharacterized membrane protein (GlpM family)
MPIGEKETFSRWLLVGIPLLLTMGVLATLVLHVAVGVPALNSTWTAAVLVIVQFGLYVPMYWIRRQFKKNQDLRPAIVLFGIYCWVMGFVVIYYKAHFHIGAAQDDSLDDYFGFSVYMLVIVGLALLLFSRRARKKRTG